MVYATAHAAITVFDDPFIYVELAKPCKRLSIPTRQALQPEARLIFEEWAQRADQVHY